MQPIRTPRIVIEDLPIQERLSAAEMAAIVGAGLYRPTLERLETRDLLSAIATSTLGGTLASFSLNNGVLSETRGPQVGIQASSVQGLFQSQDAAGHQIVFDEAQNYLYEFTPKGWVGIGHADQVAQAGSSALFFDHGAALYSATGVPANTAAGHRYLGPVQGLFQGKDSAGNPAAYKLVGSTLSYDLGHGWKTVPGMVGVTQVVVDGSGLLYARLHNNTVYTVNGSSGEQLATGVTAMAVDTASEAVMLQGTTGYLYADGGIGVSGGVIASNGAVPRYAIDSQGNLYTLLNRTLTVAATSYGGSHTLATGVTQMVMTAAGGVAVLEGPHSFAFYSGLVGSSGSSTNASYALDGAGNLYQLQGGTVYRSGTTGLQPISGHDVRQLVTAENGTLFALSTNGTVYRYPGSGSVWTPVSGNDVTQLVVDGGGAPFALSSNGIVYRYPGSGSVWTPVSGNDVRNIVVDGAGAVYAFTTEGVVFRYPGSGSVWTAVSGNDVTQLQVAGDGTLFALSSNGTVYRYPGGGQAWQPVSGNDVIQLVVDRTGTPFALSSNGIVYRYPGSGSVWTAVSGNDVTQLQVAGDGTLFALSGNGIVYRYPGSGSVWTPVSGHDVTQLVVDGSGTPFALSTNGIVYRYPGSGSVWTPVSGNDVRKIVVDGAGAVYAFTTAGVVFRYPGSGSVWTPVSGHDVTQLVVDGDGTLFALSSNGTVYRYPGFGHAWQPISGNDVIQLVVDRTATPFALSTNGTVYRYPGSGSSWTPVSGNDVRQLLVQGNGVLFALSRNGTVYTYPGSGSVWTPVSDRIFGAGSSLVVGVNGMIYLNSGQHLYQWSQESKSWIEPLKLASSTTGLGLNDGGLSDVIPSSPADAKEKWDHVVGEAQHQGGIILDNVVDYEVYSAAVVGAGVYVAGAADMAAQFGNRGEDLSAADTAFFRATFPALYTRTILDSVKIHYGCTMPNAWYSSDTQGMTFGFNIYLAPNKSDLSDRDRLTLIGHELVHAIQYDRLGQVLFAFGYQYFQELTKAGGDYRQNSMEQEAYRQEDRVAVAYDRAIKVVNETYSTIVVRLTYVVPDPNRAPGLYLTDPTITLHTDLTVPARHTVIAYQPTRPDASLLPLDDIRAEYDIVNVQITSSTENTIWPKAYKVSADFNAIIFQPAFDGI